MCGLIGIVGAKGATVDAAVVRRMSAILRHRGPDDDGTYITDSVGFGFRRLSILDLSPSGHQPMLGPGGDTVIVFNGEIYNYIELRNELESLGHRFHSTGDTEVLLHAYLQWGAGCLEKLNGMWAFLIYDRRRRIVFGSRDRFGKKPLYRYRRGDYLLFGSEIKAILASGYYRGGVNWTVASRFFLEDSFFESQDTRGETFYADISQIPAGSAFEVDAKGTLKEWRYWSIGDIPQATESDPPESFYELFEDAVRLRLRSDVPVGIFLSGGLDSTAIACAVAKLRNDGFGRPLAPLLAFSYQAKEYDETRYIDDTVKQTGVELVTCRPEPRQLLDTLEQVLWYQDEPLHSLVALITYELSRLASARGVKVILNGGGPDEFLGYPSFSHHHWQHLLRTGHIPHVWGELRASHDGQTGPALSDLGKLVATQLKAVIRELPGGRNLARRKRDRRRRNHAWFTPELASRLVDDDTSAGESSLDAALKHAVEIAPLPYYLRLEDRNSMAHSIETRMPFLDYRLVSLAFRLPAEWKMRAPWNKYVLRAAMRDRIPESVRTRRDKMGFPVPAKTWFAAALFDPMQDLLSSQALRDRGIYRIDAIRRDLERHKNGAVDVSRRLFELFEFEVWSQLAEGRANTTASSDRLTMSV